MAQKRRGSSPKAKKVGDLEARANRAGAVKGGIVIDWMPKSGADRPGETQYGVIAIIQPAGGGR